MGLAYRGSRVECPCCDTRFRQFAPFKAPNRVCWSCGSLERHRQIAVLFRRRPELLRPGMRVLHVAPEAAIRRLLPAVEYVAGDLHPRRGEITLDVTSIQFPDEAFDVVLCNHVMEHIPDDRAAMRELQRVLRPGGWGLVMTPVIGPVTDEDPTVTDPQERLRRFGQTDHVRQYGWDYVDRLAESGFRPEVVPDGFWADAKDRFRLGSPTGVVEPMFLVHKDE